MDYYVLNEDVLDVEFWLFVVVDVRGLEISYDFYVVK